jgi:hypothetical protein
MAEEAVMMVKEFMEKEIKKVTIRRFRIRVKQGLRMSG